MSARGRKTRLIGSSTSSYGGNSAARPAADCSPCGTRSGSIPQACKELRGHLADGRHLQAREGPSVQPVLFELLPYGPDGIDRGEGHPLVAALDQPSDCLVHLQADCAAVQLRWWAPLRCAHHRCAAAPPSARPGPWYEAPAPASRRAAWSHTSSARDAARPQLR